MSKQTTPRQRQEITKPDEIKTVEDIVKLLLGGETNWLQYGKVAVHPHPTNPDLRIFNYRNDAFHGEGWTQFEILARGLILNAATGEVVGRSFDKFFNYGEYGVPFLPSGKIKNVYEKIDGCFIRPTKIQCWDGSTVAIGDIVSKGLNPVLIGMDTSGNLVPSYITGRFNNGRKPDWLKVTLSSPVSKKSGAAGLANIMRVTTNHEIFSAGKFVRADALKIGDEVTHFNPSISKRSLHLIKSGLLGDGTVIQSGNGFGYRESHKEEHLEYIQETYKSFGDSAVKIFSTVSGFGTNMYVTGCKAYPEIKSIRNEWYVDGKINIPQDITWIDDFSVAKWYMDDGSLSHSDLQEDRANLSTNSFSYEDVCRLANYIANRYEIKCTVYESKGWNIRISAGRDKAINRFWEAIAPYIVDCMKYKLPERYRNTPYIAYEPENSGYKTTNALILNVESVEVNKKNLPSGSVGFDIETTTHNYFANGILVHNCLGVIYRNNGQYAISTRGRFDSGAAIWATQFLNDHFDLTGLENELTLIFEIVNPSIRVIVDYEGLEDIILLAARNRFTGEYIEIDKLCEIAARYNFNLPAMYSLSTIDEIVEASKLLDENAEGYVVEYEDGSRWKIKGDRYRHISRLVINLNFRNTVRAMRDGVMDAYLDLIPTEFMVYVDRWIAKIETYKADIINYMKDILASLPEETRNDKKSLAIWITENYGKKSSEANYLLSVHMGKDISRSLYQEMLELPNEFIKLTDE